MIIGIQDEILRINSLGLLDRLLADKTTKANILWATDAYSDMGSDYQRDKEIKAPLITGEHSGIIKNRARKALEQQFERTRQHAEVFTPLWVCAKMNDYADEVWFGKPEVFTKDGEPTERVDFQKGKSWQRYVDSRRLEITCGEAPYLVSRYDVSTGESIPIERRIGLLDRKLRVVNENAATEDEWLKWTLRAFQSTYGYEFQGDNVLISRVNLLTTFEEYLTARWKRKPTKKEYAEITNIIAWNLWQMDGLTSALPYCKAEDEYRQMSIFDWLGMNENVDAANTQLRCRIMNWLGGRSVEFINLPVRGNHGMKFDFIIGNPPYQEEVAKQGDRANPIYDKFMEGAYAISDVVELIHPARFLYNAGQTSKTWNKKMLNDEHLKVIHYEPDASKIFPNTDIKGGVAITLHNTTVKFGAIGTFSPHKELTSIAQKISAKTVDYLDSIVSSRGMYRFTEKFYSDYPYASENVGNGTGNMIVSNIFEKMNEVFHDEPNDKSKAWVCIIGRVNNKRAKKYINAEYVIENEFLHKYNVMLAEANGTGKFGETLSYPAIMNPNEGATDTFISIGHFETEYEAKALINYIRTKFLRAMLGINKATQHNPKAVWRSIPLQDFAPTSDIDWSKSIPQIDQQLYAKYGLDESEIAFIESHVKEMK